MKNIDFTLFNEYQGKYVPQNDVIKDIRTNKAVSKIVMMQL